MLEAALTAGKSPSDAEIARRAGLHGSSMGKDPVCRSLRELHSKPSKVSQAVALVDSGATIQREAARQVGVHESAISKYRLRQKLKQENTNGETDEQSA